MAHLLWRQGADLSERSPALLVPLGRLSHLDPDARQDRDGSVVDPAGRLDALEELDHLETAGEVSQLGEHVDRRLDDADGLV